jgi:hypothetical protein
VSPLQIEILLQHYYSPRGYTGPSVGSESYREAVRLFTDRGLLDGYGDITDKGRECVDRLRAVPMEVEAS